MDQAERAEEGPSEPRDRRADPRYGVDENAQMLLLKHGSSLACRVVELSLNGCRLYSLERFPAGARTRVEVAFRVRGLAFRFSGMTQWTDGRHLVGIRFADVPARRKEELVEALSEIKAELAAKEAERQAAEERAAEEELAAAAPASEEIQSGARVESGTLRPILVPIPAPAPAIPDVPRSLAEGALVSPLSGAPLQAVKTGQPVAEAGSRPAGSGGTDQDPPQPPLAEKTEGESPQPAAPQGAEAQPGAAPAPAGIPAKIQRGRRERRERAREAVDTSAVIDLIRIASRLEGRILDLSLSGCRIRTGERFPVGIYTRVETEFHLEGLPFRLGGVIQAIHDRQTVGIRFLDMSGRKREQLEQLIEEIQELKQQETKDDEPGTAQRS